MAGAHAQFASAGLTLDEITQMEVGVWRGLYAAVVLRSRQAALVETGGVCAFVQCGAATALTAGARVLAR